MEIKHATLETEIYNVLEDCLEHKLSTREMIDVFSTLGLPEGYLADKTALQRTNQPNAGNRAWANHRGSSSNNGTVRGRLFAILFLTLFCVATVEYWDSNNNNTLKFHALAIFRIILIKVGL